MVISRRRKTMGSVVHLLSLIIIVCMPGCYLSQACRSVPVRLLAVDARKPYLSRHYARGKLASATSANTQKAASLSAASGLLALLGGKQQALSVDPAFARQILPYLRFLVPPDLPHIRPPSSLHGSLSRSLLRHKMRSHGPSLWKEEFLVDSLIHWPPPVVADLARKAVEWNGDASVILNALSKESHLVPDVEGAIEQRCQLTKYTRGHRFVKEELNEYFAFLFETIAALAPAVGLNVTLNRFDLFHGHLFLANDTGRLGILFHAREYPAYNEETFPVHLGFCQVGSPLCYDDSMNLRNILWLAPMPDCSSKNCTNMASWLAPGSLLVLDAHPEGIIYKHFVPDYVDVVRTIYEDDFGDVIVDVNYFSTPNDKLVNRLYIC